MERIAAYRLKPMSWAPPSLLLVAAVFLIDKKDHPDPALSLTSPIP